jgi:alcohol dehydrogenase class IV
MSAAIMGATAFQKGLGAIHALSHPIGALYNTHHGTTNAVVMQAVLRFNRPAIEDKLALAAAYMGIAGGYDGFFAFVGEINARLGIPTSLAAMGVTAPDREAILDGALKDPSCGGDPVELTRDSTAVLIDALI